MDERSTGTKVLNREVAFDYISRLPDHLLHYIVSFLSTKEAIQTSKLAKRWLYIWTSIQNVELVDDSSSNHKLCPEFVSRVLNLRDTSDIDKLHLQFSAPVDNSHLYRWIENAGRHNVRHLDLNLSVNGHVKLPKSLFQSLVVLKVSVKSVLKAPKFTQFSHLTTLSLAEITFSGKLSVQRLFSNCPVLEDLALVNCEWNNIKKITFCIPSLKRLIIIDELHLSDFSYMRDCVIKIYVPNLKDLYFESCLKDEFHFKDMSSLVYTSIDFTWYTPNVNEAARRVSRILKGVCRVKWMSISSNFFFQQKFPRQVIKWLRFVSKELEFVQTRGHHIPQFCCLTSLEVTSALNFTLSNLVVFLKTFPNLQLLDLAKGVGSDSEEFSEADWAEAPCCLNSSLEKIIISNFQATENEKTLLKFLLKNATVLKTIAIYPTSDLLEGLEKQEKNLDSFKNLHIHMSSDCCEIEFYAFPREDSGF